MQLSEALSNDEKLYEFIRQEFKIGVIDNSLGMALFYVGKLIAARDVLANMEINFKEISKRDKAAQINNDRYYAGFVAGTLKENKFWIENVQKRHDFYLDKVEKYLVEHIEKSKNDG